MFFDRPPNLHKPGLFITGTDTGVGKTLVACAIAAALREARHTVGVSKPFSAGCHEHNGQLVHPDTLALAHQAQSALPLDVINPICVAEPLAPAVALEQNRQPIDPAALRESLERIDRETDLVLIEGAGGLLVPLLPGDPPATVFDLARELTFPVLVIARAGLGTLNHTAMTVRLLEHAGLAVAGLVVNSHASDLDDPSIASNRDWLARMTGRPVLASIPRTDAPLDPQQALPPSIQQPIAAVDWSGQLAPPRLG